MFKYVKVLLYFMGRKKKVEKKEDLAAEDLSSDDLEEIQFLEDSGGLKKTEQVDFNFVIGRQLERINKAASMMSLSSEGKQFFIDGVRALKFNLEPDLDGQFKRGLKNLNEWYNLKMKDAVNYSLKYNEPEHLETAHENVQTQYYMKLYRELQLVLERRGWRGENWQ